MTEDGGAHLGIRIIDSCAAFLAGTFAASLLSNNAQERTEGVREANASGLYRQKEFVDILLSSSSCVRIIFA